MIILGRAMWFTSVSWNSWRNNNRSGRYFRFDWRVELHLNGLCAIVERSPLEKSSFLRSPLDPDCQSNFAFPAFSLRFSVDRFPPVFWFSIALRPLFGPLKKPPMIFLVLYRWIVGLQRVLLNIIRCHKYVSLRRQTILDLFERLRYVQGVSCVVIIYNINIPCNLISHKL